MAVLNKRYVVVLFVKQARYPCIEIYQVGLVVGEAWVGPATTPKPGRNNIGGTIILGAPITNASNDIVKQQADGDHKPPNEPCSIYGLS